MKQANKGPAPACLYEHTKPGGDWRVWNQDVGAGDSKACREEIRERLASEQANLCCYCGRDLDHLGPWHIDHFLPQHKFQSKIFDYSNLFASCGPNHEPGTAHDDRTCGQFKSQKFDEALMISPSDPDCEGRFDYDDLGVASPASVDDAAAEYMINTLCNLNQTKLGRARKALYEELFFLFIDDDNSVEITDDIDWTRQRLASKNAVALDNVRLRILTQFQAGSI